MVGRLDACQRPQRPVEPPGGKPDRPGRRLLHPAVRRDRTLPGTGAPGGVADLRRGAAVDGRNLHQHSGHANQRAAAAAVPGPSRLAPGGGLRHGRRLRPHAAGRLDLHNDATAEGVPPVRGADAGHPPDRGRRRGLHGEEQPGPGVQPGRHRGGRELPEHPQGHEGRGLHLPRHGRGARGRHSVGGVRGGALHHLQRRHPGPLVDRLRPLGGRPAGPAGSAPAAARARPGQSHQRVRVAGRRPDSQVPDARPARVPGRARRAAAAAVTAGWGEGRPHRHARRQRPPRSRWNSASSISG